MIKRLALLSAIGFAALAGSAAASLAQGLVPCAREGGYCNPPYPTTVIYGARGRTTAQEVGRGIPCNNYAFGDPAPGTVKQCWYVARRPGPGFGPGPGYPPRPGYGSGYPDGGYNWRPCASEGGYCSFSGTRRVRYGANGRFLERVARNGILCGNPTFGGDPSKGDTKACYVRD